MKNLAGAAILLFVILVSGCAGCDEDILLKACPIGSQDSLPCVIEDDGNILVDEKITSRYSGRGMCSFGRTTCVDTVSYTHLTLPTKA